MKQLIIDRFEGTFEICEDSEQKYFAIEKEELPSGAKEGTVLQIDAQGILSIDEAETNRRRQRMLEKQRKLFGE